MSPMLRPRSGELRRPVMTEEAAEQIVAGEPRLRALHQVFVLSGCRDSRGHLNSDVIPLRFENKWITKPRY